MSKEKVQEILESIIETEFGQRVTAGTALGRQLSATSVNPLIEAIKTEFDVTLSTEAIRSAQSLEALSSVLEAQLRRDSKGRTIADVYSLVERLAREELHLDISWHWYARWDDFYGSGNWLTRPEPFDFYELRVRIEEVFNVSIPDQDLKLLETVGETVRYVWSQCLA